MILLYCFHSADSKVDDQSESVLSNCSPTSPTMLESCCELVLVLSETSLVVLVTVILTQERSAIFQNAKIVFRRNCSLVGRSKNQFRNATITLGHSWYARRSGYVIVIVEDIQAPNMLYPNSKAHGAQLGPTGPRCAPCWSHELCCVGMTSAITMMNPLWIYCYTNDITSHVYTYIYTTDIMSHAYCVRMNKKLFQRGWVVL